MHLAWSFLFVFFGHRSLVRDLQAFTMAKSKRSRRPVRRTGRSRQSRNVVTKYANNPSEIVPDVPEYVRNVYVDGDHSVDDEIM